MMRFERAKFDKRLCRDLAENVLYFEILTSNSLCFVYEAPRSKSCGVSFSTPENASNQTTN